MAFPQLFTFNLILGVIAKENVFNECADMEPREVEVLQPDLLNLKLRRGICLLKQHLLGAVQKAFLLH